MRQWHRWVGFPAAFLFVFISVTGIGLQIEQTFTKPEPGHGPPAMPSAATLPDDATLAAMAIRVAQSARSANPALKAERVELAFVGGQARGTVGALAPFGPHLIIDGNTGKVVPETRRGFDLHLLLLDLHAGFSFGMVGHVLSALAGFALLTLSLTGLKVYFDMFTRRSSIGKNGLFWK